MILRGCSWKYRGKNHLDLKSPSQGCSKSTSLRGHFILSLFSGSRADQNMEITEFKCQPWQREILEDTHTRVGLAWPQKWAFSGDINLGSHMGHKENPGRNLCSELFTLQHCTRTGMSCSPGKQETHLGRRRMHSIYLGLFVHSSMSLRDG